MFENVLMTTFTPLCDTNEFQEWENQPFSKEWSKTNQCKSLKALSVTKTIKKKIKRKRTSFTINQLRVLETTFTDTKYLDRQLRTKLAKDLKLEEKCIKLWFQNRRMKEKKEFSESSDCSSDSAVEPVKTSPKNVITNDTPQISKLNNMINMNYDYTEVNQGNANRSEYIFNLNEGAGKVQADNYQNYNSMSCANYNEQIFTTEYFQNGAVICPTQCWPSTTPEYTNLDNQNYHFKNMYNWLANDFKSTYD
ncbi:unnamed protein product [Euphydryas editha]|uniref:Homeobox domain-containing protein n=1 Tax=Euphydryas editha TaxID=104508 RepID=A0AAU9TER0_EUPED|nr:unnamed protein product [Euphydryas editha]